jgi:hypothetical protein
LELVGGHDVPGHRLVASPPVACHRRGSYPSETLSCSHPLTCTTGKRLGADGHLSGPSAVGVNPVVPTAAVGVTEPSAQVQNMGSCGSSR